jgi:hypothetical protein
MTHPRRLVPLAFPLMTFLRSQDSGCGGRTRKSTGTNMFSFVRLSGGMTFFVLAFRQ